MGMVKLTLIPLVGGEKAVVRELPAGISVRDAILSSFPELSTTRLVVFDGNEPVSPDIAVGELRSGRIVFWPYTLGG
jgi:hypothetical protein